MGGERREGEGPAPRYFGLEPPLEIGGPRINRDLLAIGQCAPGAVVVAAVSLAPLLLALPFHLPCEFALFDIFTSTFSLVRNSIPKRPPFYFFNKSVKN